MNEITHQVFRRQLYDFRFNLWSVTLFHSFDLYCWTIIGFYLLFNPYVSQTLKWLNQWDFSHTIVQYPHKNTHVFYLKVTHHASIYLFHSFSCWRHSFSSCFQFYRVKAVKSTACILYVSIEGEKENAV